MQQVGLNIEINKNSWSNKYTMSIYNIQAAFGCHMAGLTVCDCDGMRSKTVLVSGLSNDLAVSQLGMCTSAMMVEVAPVHRSLPLSCLVLSSNQTVMDE